MWWHSFRFTMAMRHRRYPFASLCLFGIFSLVYALAEMHRPAYPTHASTQVVLTQRVEERIPVIDGSWDLMWMDSTKELQKVRICVKQNGTRLVIRSEGSQSIRMKKNTSIPGFITPHQISFTLVPRRTGEMVFTGKLENGIICGTTNTGLPWMAMRHLD